MGPGHMGDAADTEEEQRMDGDGTGDIVMGG